VDGRAVHLTRFASMYTRVRHNLARVDNLLKIFARDHAISAKIRFFIFPVPCPAAFPFPDGGAHGASLWSCP
jgi:hypothetical protein